MPESGRQAVRPKGSRRCAGARSEVMGNLSFGVRRPDQHEKPVSNVGIRHRHPTQSYHSRSSSAWMEGCPMAYISKGYMYKVIDLTTL